MLGWGVVGLGRAADVLVGPAIAADPNSRLVAAVGRDPGRTKDFAERHGARIATTDEARMLADPAVDVVAVLSPNGLHRDTVIAAARAGKHVYCDKPMALDAADAAAMVTACADAGVRLGLNFQGRHNRYFQAVKRIVDSGEIGDVVSIQLDASPGDTPLTGWNADPALAGMGSVHNIAVHIYDLARFLTGGEVVEVTALLDTGRADALERLPMVLMRFSTGALVYANGNQRTAFPLNDLVVHGTRGRVDGRGVTRVTQVEQLLRVTTADDDRVERHRSSDAYVRTVAAFSAAVLAGRDPDPSGLDGLRSVQLTDAIRRSAREGRHVAPLGDRVAPAS